MIPHDALLSQIASKRLREGASCARGLRVQPPSNDCIGVMSTHSAKGGEAPFPDLRQRAMFTGGVS